VCKPLLGFSFDQPEQKSELSYAGVTFPTFLRVLLTRRKLYQKGEKELFARFDGGSSNPIKRVQTGHRRHRLALNFKIESQNL
jgi:hypothetical protein